MTFAKQIEILLQQVESDLVYFAEDDYDIRQISSRRCLNLYALTRMYTLLLPMIIWTVTHYEFHRRAKWLKISGQRHWRTAASTCLTFLTRKQTLQQERRVFQSYCRGNFDSSLWLSLTKQSLFNPIQFWRFAIQDALFCEDHYECVEIRLAPNLVWTKTETLGACPGNRNTP